MKKVECANEAAAEIRKSEKRRYSNASSFKKIIKDGKKHCAWCGSGEIASNRKYCTDACRDNCYAFVGPQNEFGLEYHLQSQDFKCNDCGFDYMPIIEKMSKEYEEKNFIGWNEKNTQASPYFFSSFKNRVECEVGKERKPEVDHVVAISLGGDSVGFNNHQVLCYKCHKNKTKEDMGKIAKHKKEEKAKKTSINEDLHKLGNREDLKCFICQRKYPETILNIEGVIHHNLRGYRCIDNKSCTKEIKKIRKKRKAEREGK